MKPDELPEERDVHELLTRLDHPLPHVSVDDIRVRARRRERHNLAWAAGIVLALALASAGAYAAPGSPLPDWLARLGRTLGLTTQSAVPVAPVDTLEARSAESSGIALALGDSLLIRFVDSIDGGFARVQLTDSSEIQVRAPAGSSRFVSEPDRLLIERLTADTVDILLPRRARGVRLEVGTRVVARKDGQNLTGAGAVGAGGLYVVPLGPSGR